MFFKITISNNRVLSVPAAILCAALIALSVGPGVAQVKYDVTIKELKIAAAWSSRINKVAQDFGEIINSTSQLDEISEGVLSGKIESDFASRQFKSLLSSILIKFNNTRDAAKELGTPPIFQDERLQRRISGVSENLLLSEKTARKMMKASGALFIEAKTGNKGTIVKLYKKNIRTYSSLLELQNVLLLGQVATYSSDEANYYHYKGMYETYGAIIYGLNAILPVFESGSVDIEMLDSADMKLKISKNTYIIGRRILKKSINKYLSIKVSSKNEKNNKQILLKALRSVYESFDIEDEINIVVEEFISGIRKDIHTYNPDYFHNISINGNILENKRAKIMFFRQNIVRGIK